MIMEMNQFLGLYIRVVFERLRCLLDFYDITDRGEKTYKKITNVEKNISLMIEKLL